MTARRAALLDLLTAYRPDDADEAEYRLRMLDLAAASHDPYSRLEYAPGHFTASGFVVHPQGDRILLVRHEKLGIWVQPGGHVDADDPGPLEAATREVGEEVGLTAIHPVSAGLLDVDVHVFDAVGDQPRHLHFDLRFGFVAGDDFIRPLDGALDARWASAEDFDVLGVDRSVRRPAGKVLGLEVADGPQ